MVHSASRSTPPTVTAPVAMTDLTGADASTDPITPPHVHGVHGGGAVRSKVLEDHQRERTVAHAESRVTTTTLRVTSTTEPCRSAVSTNPITRSTAEAQQWGRTPHHAESRSGDHGERDDDRSRELHEASDSDRVPEPEAGPRTATSRR